MPLNESSSQFSYVLFITLLSLLIKNMLKQAEKNLSLYYAK